MPHTSHKKKAQRNKRAEITDENGWTRVTTTNPTQRSPRPLQALTARDALENKEDEDEKNIVRGQWTPSSPVDGTTADKLEKQYFEVEKKWLNTESYKALEAMLQSKCDQDVIEEIDQCIVFGTGSYCGHIGGWIERFDVSLYQLAAFKSVVDKIEQMTGKRPKAFAQEPVYNDFDVELLSKLDITRIEHPQGFKILTPNSLVYAPAAELMVGLRALAANPSIAILTGKLDFYWRNDRGEACTDRICVYVDGTLEDEEPKPVHELTVGDEEKMENSKEHYKDRIEQGLSILEDFKKGKDLFELPELDVKDQPFWGVHVYVRKGADDVHGEVDEEVEGYKL